MATDVARLAMQIEVSGAKRAQSTLTSLQTGAIKLTKATDAQVAAQYRLNSSFQAAAKSSRSMAGAFRLQKGAVQQAGYQIGDFAVQVGSGQSAIVAFGQQASQLAGVLGPGGAVLGAVIAIGAAVGGAMFRGFMDGKTAADELESAMDILSDTIEQTDNDTFGLTERIRELAQVSRVAAQLELQRGLIATKDAANSAAEAIAEMTEDRFDTTILGDFEGAISQAERLERLGIDIGDAFDAAAGSSAREWRDGLSLIREEAENLNDEFGITEDSARHLISAIAVSRINPTVEGFQRLQSALFAASQSGPSVNSEFVKIASNLSNLASQAVEAIQRGEDITEIINNFDEALKASDPSLVDYNEKVKELGQSFKDQAATIGLTERQVALYKLQRLEANGADSEAVETARRQINASFDKIEAFKQEEERLKLLREQYRITAAEDPLLQRVSAQNRGQDIIDDLRKNAQQVRLSLDEEFAIRKAHKDRVIALDDALRLGVIDSAEERNRLEVESARRRNQQLDALEAEKVRQSGTYMEQYLFAMKESLMGFDDLSTSVINNFSSQFGSALESVVFDFQSVDDAGKAMLEALLRGTINTLGQMAAQWIAYRVVQAVTNSATATAAASAMTLEAAAAQQLAAINAFSSTAAIPVVGPAAAPAAAGAAIAATSPFVTAVGALSAGMASATTASFEGGGFTGTGSRSGGIDGKGGFPAILHPNETVIDHELAGRSSAPAGQSVNQTIVMNVSGDVTAKTRQEIMKAIPMIRQQAKQSVLQAAGEGGAMSRAMGRRS